MQDYKRSKDKSQEEIYSNAVRAGKRTYFFDVRETRGADHYLTITESKKKFDDQGNFRYEKHKIFLYKEDFEKFADALSEAVDVIKKLQSESGGYEANAEETYSDVNFESLG